jgi:hypothetical protein
VLEHSGDVIEKERIVVDQQYQPALRDSQRPDLAAKKYSTHV